MTQRLSEPKHQHYWNINPHPTISEHEREIQGKTLQSQL